MTKVNYDTLRRLDGTINLESRSNLVRIIQLYFASTFNMRKDEWTEMIELIMQNNFYESQAMESKKHSEKIKTIYSRENARKLSRQKILHAADVCVQFISIVPAMLEIQPAKVSDAKVVEVELGMMNLKGFIAPVTQRLFSTVVNAIILYNFRKSYDKSNRLQAHIKTVQLMMNLTVWKATVVIASRYLRDLDDEIADLETIVDDEKEGIRKQITSLQEKKNQIFATLTANIAEMTSEKQRLLDLSEKSDEMLLVDEIFDLEKQYKTLPVDKRFVEIMSRALHNLGIDPTEIRIDEFVEDFIPPTEIATLNKELLTLKLVKATEPMLEAIGFMINMRSENDFMSKIPVSNELKDKLKLSDAKLNLDTNKVKLAKAVIYVPLIAAKLVSSMEKLMEHLDKVQSNKEKMIDNKGKLIKAIISAIDCHVRLGTVLKKVDAEIKNAEEIKDKFKKGLSAENKEYREACYKMYESILDYLKFKESLFKAYNEIIVCINIVDELRIKSLSKS